MVRMMVGAKRGEHGVNLRRVPSRGQPVIPRELYAGRLVGERRSERASTHDRPSHPKIPAPRLGLALALHWGALVNSFTIPRPPGGVCTHRPLVPLEAF